MVNYTKDGWPLLMCVRVCMFLNECLGSKLSIFVLAAECSADAMCMLLLSACVCVRECVSE